MERIYKLFALSTLIVMFLSIQSCDDSEDAGPAPLDPDTAPKASVDRFSEDAGTLMVRTESNGLPAANAAINFDSGPFITTGLGPGGEVVEYYNFDVQPVTPAPIYVLFHENEAQVEGQLNIVGVIPGDVGYNDFWLVVFVTVPDDYVANTVTDVSGITSGGFLVEETNIIVNCPIVPDGSTASKRLNGEAAGLVRGWYKDQVVYYFNFSEKMLTTESDGTVPLSPIHVCFNINPGETGGGPASGFVVETGTDQTHNVVATLPEDALYSPLWLVFAYDNADFDNVSDLSSALAANNVGMELATVNCPVVSINTP